MDSSTAEAMLKSAPSPSSSVLLEDFGQRVDLTRRIREVLLNYPEGTTVLKELIQNADDAGASKVCLCLDRRSHATQSLLDDKLAQWQGPALLAYNDAVFTEDDFISISRVGGSTKQSQAWKTGRFGVGFNSVYHLTDLPSFVSGKYVVLFDPQGVYLPNVSTANPGKRIEYVNSSAISLYKDQLFPYCAFGCDMRSRFHGTLFRFPLRNADQAVNSKLSKQAYLEDDISSMFAQLYEEGVLSLLFLKSILSIEMYVWDIGVPEPQKIYSCYINSAEDTVWHRQALLRLSKSMNVGDYGMDAFTLNFLSEAVAGDNSEKRSHTFYIVQTMASSSSRIGSFAATAAKDFDIHLLPWASVATCVSHNLSNDEVLNLGRAFCFLPLPVKTGLKVHINGYFEVSSNRRGIWYGDDMDRSGRIRSLWNKLLLEDVVAPSFSKLLLGIRDLLGPTDFYYSFWPSGSFEEPWSILVERIFRVIIDDPVLYSEVQGGKWVSPRSSFLHDMEFSRSKELGEALVQLGMPTVCLPNALYNMLLNCVSDIQQKVVTPVSVRHYLRDCRYTSNISRLGKLILLEYCLEDLIDTDVGSYAYDLPLLPLANGDFGLLSESSKGIIYFICNDLEYMLLQEISDRVIDKSIPHNISSRLVAIAKVSGANLVIFSVHEFISLFSEFVPSEWKYRTKVLWDPTLNSDRPSSSWFALFWRYLRDHCEQLSLFSDWPILPSLSGHLYRPSRRSKLLNVEGLSDKLQEVLVKIGCKILNSNYGVEHPELSEYVYIADGTGVLEAVFDAVSSNEDMKRVFLECVKAEERDELRLFLLDPKWYIGNRFDDSHLWKCKRLPVYRVYGGGSSHLQYSDLINPRKYLPPLGCPDSLLGGDFICSLSKTEEEVLNRYYGVERMGKAQFYKQNILNRVKELETDIRDSIMVSILKELPQLSIEDASFRESLRNLEFVPTSLGSLKSPGVLYDPRNEELYALLEDSDSFPSGAFQGPGVLNMLQALGLKTTVSTDTIIQSAQHIERLMRDNQEQAHLKGKVLLSYLEVNALKWLPDPLKDDQGKMNKMFARAGIAFRARHVKGDLEKFWNDMRLICWCPVLISPPYKSLPWPTVSSKVAPPRLVRLYQDLWLVSASMRILDGECSSSALSHQLGWSSPPGGSVIAAQLLELGRSNEIISDSLLRQELALAMPRIYSILMGMIGSDEMDIVKAVLEGCRWIWVGDGFATSDEVVLNGPLHLAPYIRVIPIDLAAFRELFLELGIREFLRPSDYANILSRMATKKDSIPLDAQEISAAILIAQHLAEAQIFEDQMKIYLPDVSCRLFTASDLVYNDAPWLMDSENGESPFASSVILSSAPVQRFVHGNISNDVAERLGVRSLRRSLLAESADSMNLSLSGAAEAFGQHEALTTRLKHILEMYADGPSVLFELVQNAEDAKASEVIFLLDKTQYGTSSVLSREMAEWQGPALYCFNDSVFSPQDLYAISRIGQESKLEKPFAIGRFGLGFNSVYHFTDIPTFVSGENIVMFDPHASNLPGISPSHPGLRIKFAGRKILEQFPDQFSPFLHFGCDLQHSYPGTLFRFPLRTTNVASRSQIKKEAYAPEDVLSLFSSFSEVVSETLLFLRNVKTISLYVKEGDNSEMQLLHGVRKNLISVPEADTNPFNEFFSFMHGNQQDKIDKVQFLNKMSKHIDKDLPWRSQKIVVSEQSTSGCKSHLWLTTECLGGTRMRNNYATYDKSFFKFVPWACVALHLNSLKIEKEMNRNDANFEELSATVPERLHFPLGTIPETRNFDGRAFCFLPLPINTGLPVHVNTYFELSSNRRDIWFGNDMAGGGKMRSDWNMYLLEDVVAPAYGHLLEKAALEIGPCDLFFSFWPTTGGFEPWRSLVRRLYQFVSDSGLRILYTKARGGQWISTKQAIFPDFTFDKASELVEALADAGLPVATAPKALVDRFMEICPSLYFLTPQLLRTLLIRRRREFKDRNAMILTLEYCLLDFKIPVTPDSFYGLPLIPLSNGSFAKLEKRGSSELIYVTEGDGYGLLKDVIPHQLVDSTISNYLYRKLSDLARSEDFNISFLTCPLLERLLLRLLPADWQNAKQVSWDPAYHGHPSFEWMRLLWSYLKSNCDDLSLFSKWPILPVENNYLMQLVENSNVIKDGGWSENLCSLLLRVGCLLLRRDLPIDHPHLKQYVQSPTAVGVLNALLAVSGKLENIEGLFSDASEGELFELRSFILQSKWFSEDSMDCSYVNVIRNIPMFESFKSRKLVALSKSTIWLKPDGVREDLLNDDFVRADSDKEKIILKNHLDLREPSRIEFYKDYVVTRMPKFIIQESMLSDILNDINLLIEDNNSFKEVFSEIPFVQACDNSWKEPCRLYDPRVPVLKLFLHGGAFFPSDNFSSPGSLDILVNLGLRQSLGFSGLLDCARSVSMLHDSGNAETVIFSKRLLACLNKLSLKLSAEGESNLVKSQTAEECHGNSLADNEENYCSALSSENPNDDGLDCNFIFSNLIDDMPREEFWSEMRAINWCPIYTDPPVQGLPWLASADGIGAPFKTRPESQMWMVSFKMHILDGECSDYLQHKLGWMDRLDAGTLCAQLIELSKCYNELKTQRLDELQKQIPLIYSELQEYVETDELEIVKYVLDGARWVWIGDDFVAPNALAFDSPMKFSPYLFVVPSELSQFGDLLLALGVRSSFDIFDYFHVLQRLQNDVKDSHLSTDQINFVNCILEAIADYDLDELMFGSPNTPLLVPDVSGVLVSAGNLVYNDAPWMENSTLVDKRFVHPSISYDLANRLGIQSLRCLSLVSEEMTKDLPCMDYGRIRELLEMYGSDFILFDLLELVDCCKAKKLHLIFDKREHPRQSLLQHNLGEFQGPALLAIMEGARLSGDEIASLQFLPPWSLRGNTLSYGLGLLSCFSVSNLPSVISDDCLYIFDPRGLALSTPSSHAPAAKMFTLKGTTLTERFRDQFSPMLIGEKLPWLSSDFTVIRMPLSSEFLEDATESGLRRMTTIFSKFMDHASRTLLFLKSVLQVSLLTWEEENPQPRQDYSIHINPLSAAARNPFSEKKWKKFQLSSLFSSSSAVIKLQVLDLKIYQGETRVDDRWLVVLSMGSGQTRNMALDRRYLAYNLTPVAGVAARISRDGHLVQTYSSSSIMSPLPLSNTVNIPVVVLGYFLVRHNQGRYLFKSHDSEAAAKAQSDAGSQLIEAWNRELMSCVCDSYVKLVLEMQKLRREPSTSVLEPNLGRVVSLTLNGYGDQIYSFWPRSNVNTEINQLQTGSYSIPSTISVTDWECLVQEVIRPFYARLIDFPVWQLYSGNLVKAEEGMFLSQPTSKVADNLLPATVCAFVREHYPVFSVPWELVTEIQAVGVTVREIKPKMVRDLLRASSASIVLRSVDTYVDVLEYCLSDIQFPEESGSGGHDESAGLGTSDSPVRSKLEGSNSFAALSPNFGRLHGMSTSSSSASGGDALEMMTSLGKALFDFGRGVVEDIGKAGSPLSQSYPFTGGPNYGSSVSEDRKLLSIASEIRGLPCPTATNHLTRLGSTEIWVGHKEQQTLMSSLAAKFVHPKVLDRSVLANIFSNRSLQSLLKLQTFSLHLLANHMRLLFHENWVNHVIDSNTAPWFSWDNTGSSSTEWGPSPEWIRLFWKLLSSSLEDLSLFSDWPLVPAFLGRPVLCRVRERHLIFFPALINDFDSMNPISGTGNAQDNLSACSESEVIQPYLLSFKATEEKYPWLLSLLNQCNIPIFDIAFMDCASSCKCLPPAGQSLGKIIASKLVASKQAGYFPELTSFLASDRDELFSLFASEYSANASEYGREELEALRDLPMYKTVTGTYTRLHGQDLCMISSTTSLKPYDERCLCFTTESTESSLLRALGVPELHDQQILVKFGFPGFEGKLQSQQEDILRYLYTNWQDLQQDSSVIEVLKETNFVKCADEQSVHLCKPKDLFDPGDALLTSVFSGVRKQFPGERFIQDEWLLILRKAGLRTSTETDIMLECAKRVEYLGGECMKPMVVLDDLEAESSNSHNEVSFEIWLLAENLMKTIFSNFAILYGNNFCNLLGKIACVPAEKGFPNIGGRRSGKRVLCSYDEAITMKDWPLAWSCAPILSRQSVVPPEYAWGQLHLRSPPTFPTVLKHLQVIGKSSGEDTLAHWPTATGLKTIDEASFEVLKYLEKIWGSLSSSALKQVAFIPVANGTRLVKASSLFARLSINLSPFAFELPALYLPFVKILKDLGLQDILSVASAKDILSNLQKACGFQRLNPNEFRAVIEILHFICDEENSGDISIWQSEAIVPDDGCRLVHARSCVYFDSYGSRYLKCIDTSRLRFVHPDLPVRVCKAMGIKKLSDVVVEELDDRQHIQTLEGIGSVSLAAVKQKLLSNSFQVAVWCTLDSIATDVPGFHTPVLENVQSSLKSIAEKLKFAKCLYTRFLLRPKSLDITLVGKESIFPDWDDLSRHRALFFVDQLKTSLFVAEPPNYISLPEVVAVVVSRVLDSPVLLPIGSLFLCPEGSEAALVDMLKLRSHKNTAEFRGGADNLLGKEILPQDAVQVQFHPLRPFYMGEIVAWRSQNGEKLKYGRVSDNVRPSAGQALYRFSIETSPGVTQHLLSSNVFSFRSISLSNEALPSNMLESDLVTVNGTSEVSGRVKTGSSKQHQPLPVQDPQHGIVSAAELVQAVQEMLSAAGIGMDVEKQSLLQTTLTLQEQLKESQAALLLEQERSEMAAKDADTAKAAWSCRVCLSNEVDVTIVPCGHVLCRRCSSAVSRCPFCRLQVSKTMRIFRP